MSVEHQKSAAILTVIADLNAGRTPDARMLADAVRALLRDLARAVPGRSVEVRVPPYGAVQCVPGPRHTRGTPPGVVETDPVTWVLLATGRLGWGEAVRSGRLRLSGLRTDLSPHLPLYPLSPPGEGNGHADMPDPTRTIHRSTGGVAE